MTDRYSKFLPVLLLALSFLSCSSEETPNADTEPFSRVLVDGIEHLVYQELPRINLEIDTIGFIDPWFENFGYPFSRIREIVALRNNLLITARGNSEIVEVGQDGSIIQVIGREGEGPGEFKSPSGISATPNHFIVSDRQLMRLSVYDEHGELIDNVKWPSAFTFRNPLDQFRVLSESSIVILNDWLALQGLTDDRPAHLLKFNFSTFQLDTLAHMIRQPMFSFFNHYEGFPPSVGMTSLQRPVFAPEFWMDASPELGIVTVTSAEYRIDFRRNDGSLWRILEAPTPDLTVTQDMRQWWKEIGYFNTTSTAREIRKFGYTPSGRNLDAWLISEQRQAISGIIIDPNQRIWISIISDDPGRNRIDVFDTDGQFIGMIEAAPLPETFFVDGTGIARGYNDDDLPVFYLVSLKEK